MTERSPREQAKHDAIHAAAQELFRRQGFEGTSMDAIALEARVSKQTLYRYYQNKEALFIAVLEQLALHHLSENAWLALRDTPMDSLATLERALTVWAQAMIKNIMQPAYVGLVRLLIAELPRFPQLSTLFIQAVPQQGGAFLQELLEDARGHGVLVVEDRELVPRLLVGALLTYILSNGLLASGEILQVPAPERVAALVHLVLVGIVSNPQEQGTDESGATQNT